MLAHFGKPYQSTKGRPGAGLGLFLVANVARTLGGSVAARNREEGGAMVTLTLPLAGDNLGRGGRKRWKLNDCLLHRRGRCGVRTNAESFFRATRLHGTVGRESRGGQHAAADPHAGLRGRGPEAHRRRIGAGLCAELHEHDPDTLIVVLTGYASIATAVEAIKLGACHYLAKPSNTDDIEAAFGRAEGNAEVGLTRAAHVHQDTRVGAYPRDARGYRIQHLGDGPPAGDAPAHAGAEAGEAAGEIAQAGAPGMGGPALSRYQRAASDVARLRKKRVRRRRTHSSRFLLVFGYYLIV